MSYSQDDGDGWGEETKHKETRKDRGSWEDVWEEAPPPPRRRIPSGGFKVIIINKIRRRFFISKRSYY